MPLGQVRPCPGVAEGDRSPDRVRRRLRLRGVARPGRTTRCDLPARSPGTSPTRTAVRSCATSPLPQPRLGRARRPRPVRELARALVPPPPPPAPAATPHPRRSDALRRLSLLVPATGRDRRDRRVRADTPGVRPLLRARVRPRRALLPDAGAELSAPRFGRRRQPALHRLVHDTGAEGAPHRGSRHAPGLGDALGAKFDETVDAEILDLLDARIDAELAADVPR